MAASGELFAKLNKWKSKADEDGLNFEAQGQSTVDRAKTSTSAVISSAASSSSAASCSSATPGAGGAASALTKGNWGTAGSSSSSSRKSEELAQKLGKWRTAADGTALESDAKQGTADAASSIEGYRRCSQGQNLEASTKTIRGRNTASTTCSDTHLLEPEEQGEQPQQQAEESESIRTSAGSSENEKLWRSGPQEGPLRDQEDGSTVASGTPASSKATSPGEQPPEPLVELESRLSKWRDKAENHGEKFESVPERSTVDRRADDNKLKLDAAPFVPGGLSSMVGKEVEVTVESATKGGKVGCATWTLRQVVEAADLQSDAFAIPDAAGSWRLHLLNSDEQWSFLKLTRGAGQDCGRSEESEMTKPSSDDPASSPSPAAPHVGTSSRQVRVAFFAGKQMSVAEVFEGSGDDGEAALTRQFRKLTSSSASQDSGGLEVGVRWKVT